MTSKRSTTPPADEPDVPDPAETPITERIVERLPSTAGGISALASANAPQVFFDDAPFCGYYNSVGDITLTAARRIAVIDGRVVGDQVITGILRGSLEALRGLKKAIEAVENLADRQLAEAVSAATGGPPPNNTAH